MKHFLDEKDENRTMTQSIAGLHNQSKAKLLEVVPWCALALVFLLSFSSTLRDLAQDWWTDPDYSYGLVVPFVAAWLAYVQHNKLRTICLSPETLLGTAVVIASQLLYLAGYFGAEFFLQRSSIILLLVGVILFVCGIEWLRQLAVPLILLVLCIPLPAMVMNQITMPLQLLASWGSEKVLLALEIPVYRTGNVLQLSNQVLNVAEACSGIRSLMALVALAVIMSSLVRISKIARILFVVSATGVAVCTNVLRISCVAIIGAKAHPRFTVGMWHQAESWIIFMAAFLLLGAELSLITRFAHNPRRTA